MSRGLQVDRAHLVSAPVRAATHRLAFAWAALLCLGCLPAASLAGDRTGFRSTDLQRIRSVGEVEIAPDGTRIAYSVLRSDRPGRPYSEVFVHDVATGRSARLGSERSAPWGARFSPDGRRIAYLEATPNGTSLTVASHDGSSASSLAPVTGTNHPLPWVGESIAWSPDGGRIAFVSSTPGPEPDTGSDPVVITRYLYKPFASGAGFNDNRRLHLFLVDVATKEVRQLTRGTYHEHSIAFAPDGSEVAFLSNHEPDPDRDFNHDVFAVRTADGSLRRLTDTRSVEYAPAYSPDGRLIAYLGTRRPRTSSETTIEDTHVFLMDRDGNDRREVGGAIDNRQGPPRFSADGRFLYTTVQERGGVRLYSLPVAGGAPALVLPPSPLDVRSSVSDWSVARDGSIAYALTAPAWPADLFLHKPVKVRRATVFSPRRLTLLNEQLLGERKVAEVEAFTFRSADGTPVEAFLTRPHGLLPDSRHPLIAAIHGGPHGQQGAGFNLKAQVYASQGWATLMVNYRGSTGYGQRFADLIFGDQNGAEARDVLAGVDAALARYRWLDKDNLGVEGGSYGGQLTNWLVTQTDRFKAAIPIAGISNLVSFNYMAYYHDYLAVEFGRYPHEDGLMDRLLERSPLRHVSRVRTPVMLIHGEDDNDVPIAEAEQFFVALKDVGVEAVLVRYPREGHGLRETGHVVDLIDRSVAWYARHFGR